MKSYEDLKKWFEENKPKIILGVCFILVFLIGFGTGRYDKEIQNSKLKTQNNSSRNPKINLDKATEVGEREPAKVLSASTTTQSCLIKGNISSKGKKIYHLPGGAFYNQVKPEQCFNAEQEAQKAGFVKSSR